VNIFLTVGSMLPFDRLVRAMDLWAAENPDASVFAQIGETEMRPANMNYEKMITPSEYRRRFEAADLIVSHVGMGTVITASECRKPLVLLARRPDFHEVTSNHQIATAKWLRGREGLCIIENECELSEGISNSIGTKGVRSVESGTRDKFIAEIRKFLES
jgi:exopolysaccharide biosynthesis glucuronosyltransferase PssE